jgi:hypothetical protein
LSTSFAASPANFRGKRTLAATSTARNILQRTSFPFPSRR